MSETRLHNILLLGLICWCLVSDAYHGAINTGSGIIGIDFKAYYRAEQRLASGSPLYVAGDVDQGGYVYAPTLALMMQPLKNLSYDAQLKFWFFMNTAALLAAVALAALAAGYTLNNSVPIGIMLFVTFRFWPTVMNLGLGQVNLVLVAILSGIIYAETRKRMDVVALLIVFGALIKLWFLGMCIYLLIRRAWKPFIACGVAFCGGMFASFTLVGWNEWAGFVKTIRLNAVQPELISQSIAGFARLRFAANGHVDPLTTSWMVNHLFVVAGSSMVLAGLGLLYFRRRTESSYETSLCVGFTALSLLLMLPLCHSEYFVLCLPLLWAFLTSRDLPGRKPWSVAVAAGIYVLFTRPRPTSGPALLEHSHGVASWLVSADFLVAAALWLLAGYEIFNLSGGKIAGNAVLPSIVPREYPSRKLVA